MKCILYGVLSLQGVGENFCKITFLSTAFYKRSCIFVEDFLEVAQVFAPKKTKKKSAFLRLVDLLRAQGFRKV